jgi:hypothetical protein
MSISSSIATLLQLSMLKFPKNGAGVIGNFEVELAKTKLHRHRQCDSPLLNAEALAR